MTDTADTASTPPDRFARFVAPARARPALWRLGVGCVVAVAVYLGLNLGVSAGLAALAGPGAAQGWGARLAEAATPGATLVLLATFLPMALGVILAARLLHRRNAGSLFGPAGATARGFALGAGVTLAIYLPLLALWEIGYDSAPNLAPGLWLLLLPLGLLGLGIQTLAEELAFRGYLLQQLAARFRSPLVWGLGPALLFGVLHFDPGRMGDSAAVAVAAATLFGVAAADLTARTGSIGLAWGVHMANNAVAILGLATKGTITGLALRVTPYGVDEMARTPWTALLELVPFLLVWLVLRRLTAG